jgi:hypothetical protein
MSVLTEAGMINENKICVSKEEREFKIIEWDGTVNIVKAKEIEDGSVLMTYVDNGLQHNVSKKYFERLAIAQL